jgi:transcriptional regulator with XRE-family HTH domain
MITAAQSKMARAGLGWTIGQLAANANVGAATVARFETGKGETIPATLAAIQRALEAAGAEFLAGNGVRLGLAKATASPGTRPGDARKPRSTGKSPAPRKAPKRKAAPKAQALPMSKEAQIRGLREQDAG